MKLVATGHNRNGQGSIEATVTLLAEDGTQLFQDSLSLSKHNSRRRFSKVLLSRFPELRGRDIEAQLLQLLWNAEAQSQDEPSALGDKPPARKSQADRLISLVADRGVQLFHTSTGVAYARIPTGGHVQIHRCRAPRFRQWLSYLLWQCEGRTPNSDALNSAITTLEGQALFQGKEYTLNNRVAFYDDAIWYDLADETWRVVKITPWGWEIVTKPPILFARYQHQKPQVEPTRGGAVEEILGFLNLRGKEQEVLALVAIITAFIPDIPHPILYLHGEKGSAKTSMFRLVNSLIDPSTEDLLMFPRDINDLAQKLSHHWTCFFDNLSTLTDWQSDILSRAVTGAGFSKRELYTDEGDIIFQIRRVIGLNGINVVATKPDLLDRCILLELERISGKNRREEKTLLTEFEQAKPRILGGVFDVLSQAMAVYPRLHLATLPRLADFARRGAAVSAVLGVPPEEFVGLYMANIQRQNVEVLTASPVASCLLSLMDGRDFWTGTPAELLDELAARGDALRIKTTIKAWPQTPNVLTRKLKEIQGNLREQGIEITMDKGRREEGKWKRNVTISRN